MTPCTEEARRLAETLTGSPEAAERLLQEIWKRKPLGIGVTASDVLRVTA